MKQVPIEFLFGLSVAICGIIALTTRRVKIGIGRPNPVFYVHMNGITAVIFGVSLVFGGFIFGVPSGYQFLYGKPLPDDLSGWLPLIGLIIVGIGVISAATSGILQTAVSAGEAIRARHEAEDRDNKQI